MKKRMVLLVLIMLLISSNLAYGEPGKWHVDDVNMAFEYGLVTESVEGNYQQDITREEFAELVVRLYEVLTNSFVEEEGNNPFTDTKNPEILKANKLGIVTGVGGGIFDPKNTITREQIATMFYRTIKAFDESLIKGKYDVDFSDKSQISKWALDGVSFMNNKEILKGLGGNRLGPKERATREQAISLVIRTYNQFAKEREIVFPDGSVYFGEVEDGVPHGIGSLSIVGVGEYYGEWVHSRIEGYGVFIFDTGEIYKGYWKDTMFHGQGTLYMENGEILNGVWENDELISANEVPTLRYRVTSYNKVELGWDDIPGVDYYHLYYSYDGEKWYYNVGEDGNRDKDYWYGDFSLEIGPMKSKESIYFALTSVKDGVESDYSNTVHVIIQSY